MRLIDADRLNEVIKRNFVHPSGFMQLVNAQPTAYDVDRVVEQLEDAQDEYYRKYHNEHVDIMYNEGKSDGIHVAIGIVKVGGVDA